jgi:hypothetical protein
VVIRGKAPARNLTAPQLSAQPAPPKTEIKEKSKKKSTPKFTDENSQFLNTK